jgi:hypothetical protein
MPIGRHGPTRVCGLIVATVLALQSPGYAECPPGVEFCFDGGVPGGGGAAECWSEELQQDICNEPPAPCDPGPDPVFQFIDDQDGEDDGQIYALGSGSPAVSCGTLTVDKTGYYQIFDTELSESCSDQLDETGYLRITNSCNPNGVAVEANAGDRFVVLDSDNTPPCTTDADCGAGKVCREGNNHGNCCVPDKPTFMGTFLLVAGENNTICLYHWCPVWLAEKQKSGTDLGFVTADCTGSVNSVHFKVGQTAIACEENETLKPCSWGCENGQCLPDPCEAANCPAYCKDGVCLSENPCANMQCKYGCKNGRCLQPKSAPGPDNDGDGYPFTADCDDNDPLVNPAMNEVCGNGIDDDCDGMFDESDCGTSATGDAGAGGDGSGGGGGSGEGDDGCSCVLGSPGGPALGLACLGLALLLLLRRRP